MSVQIGLPIQIGMELSELTLYFQYAVATFLGKSPAND